MSPRTMSERGVGKSDVPNAAFAGSRDRAVRATAPAGAARAAGRPTVDAHTHLDACGCVDAADVRAALDRAAAVGVTRVITVADDLASARWVVDAAHWDDRVAAAVALHPTRTAAVTDDRLRRDRASWPRDPRVVAVGETGLDHYWDHTPPDAQERAFRRHIDLAKRLGKPLMIHDRDAHDDVLRVLRRGGRARRTVVFHCFSGDAAMARTCVDAGYVLSFAGPVTFKNAAELREAAALVPDGAAARRDRRPVPHPAPPSRPARTSPTACRGRSAGWPTSGGVSSNGSPTAPGGPRRRCSVSPPCHRSRRRPRRAPGPRARREPHTVRRSRRVAIRVRLSPAVTVLSSPSRGGVAPQQGGNGGRGAPRSYGSGHRARASAPGPTRSGCHVVDVSPRSRRRAAPARARRAPVERPGPACRVDDLLGDVPGRRSAGRPREPRRLRSPGRSRSSRRVDDPPTECFAAVPAVDPRRRSRARRGRTLVRARGRRDAESLVAGSATAVAADKTVVVTVEGQDRVVHTFAADVAGALASAGIAVTPQDRVEPAPGTELADGDRVIFARARPLTLVEGAVRAPDLDHRGVGRRGAARRRGRGPADPDVDGAEHDDPAGGLAVELRIPRAVSFVDGTGPPRPSRPWRARSGALLSERG